MMMYKIGAGLVAALALLPGLAQAEYPEKPVEFVVPFPPGDLEDILTRMIANNFQDKYGVPAVVVNKPGGGGGPFPGAIEVANAPADGYTIGSFVMSVPVVGPHIDIAELSPNPFEPLGAFLTYPFIIAASGDAPYDDLEGLAEYSENNDVVLGHFGGPFMPTKVTFALAETMGITFQSDAAFDALDCNTLASGDADVINTTIQLVLPCLDKINVLASIGTERLSLTPDTRTVGEIAPEFNIGLWNGLFVHKDTPSDVREKIIAVAVETMASEAASQLSVETGALIYWVGPEETQALIVRDGATLDAISDLID